MFEELSESIETQVNGGQLSQMQSIIHILLKDSGVQECISRDFEYYHLDSARYFIDRVRFFVLLIIFLMVKYHFLKIGFGYYDK